jgi:hypothetical protein
MCVCVCVCVCARYLDTGFLGGGCRLDRPECAIDIAWLQRCIVVFGYAVQPASKYSKLFLVDSLMHVRLSYSSGLRLRYFCKE